MAVEFWLEVVSKEITVVLEMLRVELEVSIRVLDPSNVGIPEGSFDIWEVALPPAVVDCMSVD